MRQSCKYLEIFRLRNKAKKKSVNLWNAEFTTCKYPEKLHGACIYRKWKITANILKIKDKYAQLQFHYQKIYF